MFLPPLKKRTHYSIWPAIYSPMDSGRDSPSMDCDCPQWLLAGIIPELIINQQSFSHIHFQIQDSFSCDRIKNVLSKKLRPKWRCPKMRVPPNHPFYSWISNSFPSSYWDTPMTMETPNWIQLTYHQPTIIESHPPKSHILIYFVHSYPLKNTTSMTTYWYGAFLK